MDIFSFASLWRNHYLLIPHSYPNPVLLLWCTTPPHFLFSRDTELYPGILKHIHTWGLCISGSLFPKHSVSRHSQGSLPSGWSLITINWAGRPPWPPNTEQQSPTWALVSLSQLFSIAYPLCITFNIYIICLLPLENKFREGWDLSNGSIHLVLRNNAWHIGGVCWINQSINTKRFHRGQNQPYS